MLDCPEFAFLIFQGPASGLGLGQFPTAQRFGRRGDGVEGNQASVSGGEFSLEIRAEAVGAVDLGTGLFGCGNVAGDGAFESLERMENRVVGRIFPGDACAG